jgi:LmbE family N-acetylglucosaminyl deacetylase
MNSLIFSPHTDDAIFSMGDYISINNNFTIASAFAGIPDDDIGFKKHTLLRKEHEYACQIIGASIINNDLLDDVYGKQDESLLLSWIKDTIINYENIYIPLGIHHPDHLLLSNILFSLMDNFNKTYFIYAELPYKILYPELYLKRLYKFNSKYNLYKINTSYADLKIKAIKQYESQINNNLIEKLIVEEDLWKIIK